MEKIIDGLKLGTIWTDNINVDASALLTMDMNSVIGGVMKSASTISVMDLGKMLLQYAKDGDTAKVHELMSRGAPFTTDWLGTSPLHLAAMNNHLDTCEVLLRAGISKDARTKVDRTPLHLAVYEGHERIVELLLKNKCDVNAKDMLKMTPLHWAVEKQFRSLVTLLLRHGADPTATSKFEKTPILLAMASKQTDVFQELIRHNDQVGAQEQEEATNTLVSELEKDNYTSISTDDIVADVVYSSPEGSPVAPETHAFPATANAATAQNHKPIAPKTEDSPALKILKDHGIAMLPEDTDNTLINSALQSGRKLILSDAGKLILNYPKTIKNGVGGGASMTEQLLHNVIRTEGAIKRKPAIVAPVISPSKNAGLKTNKVIKILSAEEFNKMCGNKGANNTFRKVVNDNVQSANIKVEPNHANIQYINRVTNNKRAMMNKCKINTLPNNIKQQLSNVRLNPVQIKSLTNVQRINSKIVSPVVVAANSSAHDHHSPSADPSKHIVLSSMTSASASSLPDTVASTSFAHSNDLPSMQATANNSTVTLKAANINRNSAMISIPKNGLVDVVRQMVDLKKQTDELRKQMEIYQKQNEDYRLRLEKLEKERDGERNREDSTRQYTNTDY